MSLTIELEKPPLYKDETGAVRVGNSRVLLELVVHAFQAGASPETIVQNYTTLSLSDVYSTLGYFLRHKEEIEAYLQERESLAEEIQQRIMSEQPDLAQIRDRLVSKRPSTKANAATAE